MTTPRQGARVSSVRQRREVDIEPRQPYAKPAIVSKRQASYNPVLLAELTTKRRKSLRTSVFAIPERRAYPIHDEAHARNALARVSQHGTPEEKARVRAAVRRKYPNITMSK